jgi:hypothetical protein
VIPEAAIAARESRVGLCRKSLVTETPA